MNSTLTPALARTEPEESWPSLLPVAGGLLAFVAIPPWPGQVPLLALALLALALDGRALHRSAASGLLWPGALLVLGAGLGWLVSPLPALSEGRFMGVVAGVAAGCAVVADTRRILLRLSFIIGPGAALIIGALLVIGSPAFLKLVTPFGVVVLNSTLSQGRVPEALPTFNSNGLSLVVILLLFAAIGAVVGDQGPRRALWALGLAAGGLTLVALGSRAAWLATAVSGAALAGRGPRWIRWGLLLAAIGLGLGAVIALVVPGLFPREAIPASRLALLLSGLHMAAGRFITGVGIGAYPAAYPAFVYPDGPLAIDNPHNSYLAADLNLGLPGLVATVWLLVLGLVTGWRLRPAGLAENVLTWAALGGLAAWAFLSLFEDLTGVNWGPGYLGHSMALPAPVLYTAFLLAVAGAGHRQPAPESV